MADSTFENLLFCILYIY